MAASPTGPASLDARPRRRIWLLAPWFVAAALGVAAVLGPGRAEQSPTVPADRTAGPTPARSTVAAPSPELPPAVLADVLAVARVALGSRGLDLGRGSGPTDGAADRWVLDQVPGELQPTGDGSAEVIVHATVITRTTGGWSAPTLAAARVPIGTRPTPHVTGAAVPIEVHAATVP